MSTLTSIKMLGEEIDLLENSIIDFKMIGMDNEMTYKIVNDTIIYNIKGVDFTFIDNRLTQIKFNRSSNDFEIEFIGDNGEVYKTTTCEMYAMCCMIFGDTVSGGGKFGWFSIIDYLEYDNVTTKLCKSINDIEVNININKDTGVFYKLENMMKDICHNRNKKDKQIDRKMNKNDVTV